MIAFDHDNENINIRSASTMFELVLLAYLKKIFNIQQTFAADLQGFEMVNLEHRTDFLPSATLDGIIVYNQD